MGLLEHLKNNSSTFHLKTKEEIDVLFAEKEMLERTKGQWTSIVSIPMGGMNK